MERCLRWSSLLGAVPARVVMPEHLDTLSVDDPRARRARRDLQRVHKAMRSLSIIERAIELLHQGASPRRILELGAGDGSLMLRFARARPGLWPGVQLTLLDRQDLLSATVRDEF